MLSALRSEFGGHAEQKAASSEHGVRALARPPAGHSPRHGHAKPDPHVIVLFGATGDLAKRKLLPGLLPPVPSPGCCPRSSASSGPRRRSSRCQTTTSATRAEQACQQFGNCKPDESWDSFAARLSFGAASPEDPVAAGDRGRGGGEGDRGGVQRAPAERAHGHIGRLFHLAVPPVGVRLGGDDARLVRAGQRALAGDHREAVRHRPGVVQEAQRRPCTRCSTSRGCSASTTSSARNRSTTCSPSGSPTACSSRSGTGSTSGTCRSTCRRR